MRKNLLWIYLNIMPSAETILVIDVPMRSSRDLGRDTFTITPMSGPMHLSWFRPIQCFRISADAISSVVFGKSAEIRWLDVIGHLYTSGLAMLSVGFDWIMSQCIQRQQRTRMGVRHYTCPSAHSQTTCQGSWFLFWHHRWGLTDAISP
jgi:hypothetical protein